ncbi:MAG: DUF4139 domain-containing protein [Candidatus Obscuribacterales bacterium]|nr:DUF4139 domain-containing protein [Candidatus Obscuribacterales bacterium]
MKKIVIVALLLANSISITCRAAELEAAPPQDISLTIYNQNFGLVREERTLDLTSGINNVRVEDVAATIDPTSVSFQSLTAPNSVVVREQNYQYDLIDPVTVLSKSLGKTVKFKQFLPGRTNELTGILLNSPQAVVSAPDGSQAVTYQGLVVKTPEAVVLNPQGQVELTELPDGLVGKPSLLWKLECAKPGTHKSEISYQAANMNWNCDYVAVLDKADEKADLTSWVTLDNKSGATYKNASLKLMAGDVHRVQPTPQPMPMMAADSAEMAVAAPPPQFSEQAFAEYHLYTLQGKTTVANNETKQLSLFNASDIPVKKLFVFEPTAGEYQPYGGAANTQKVNVKIEMDNSETNHLGMPLPKGKVRVYKKDNDGALQFVGEDQIDHTPKDEKIRLYIGDAFDLTAERKQTNQVQVSSTKQRSSYQIDLRNHKKEDVTITCIEHSWGTWTILNSSQAYTKKDAKTFEFAVKVPAGGVAQVTYEIETR